MSGAVGGATGAGLSSAFNGVDIGTGLQNTLQGAARGAGSGAMVGGTMAGLNMGANAAAKEIKTIGKSITEGIDNLRTNYINKGAIERLASGLETGKNGTIKFARMTQDMLDDINNVRSAEGKNPMTNRQTKAIINEFNNHLASHKNDYGSYEEIARAAFDVLTNDNSFAAPTDQNINSLVLNDGERFANSVALDEDAGIRSISPRDKKWAEKRAIEREALLNSSSEGGSVPSSQQDNPESGLPISRSRATGDIISQMDENVNKYDQIFTDARGNKLRWPELQAELNPDNPTVIANKNQIDATRRGRISSENMSDADFIEYARQNGWNLEGSEAQSPETEVCRTTTIKNTIATPK